MIVCPRDLLLGGSPDAGDVRVYVCVCVCARRPRGERRDLSLDRGSGLRGQRDGEGERSGNDRNAPEVYRD